MKQIIYSLFFFFLITQTSFAQWYQQNSVTTKNLNSVQFIDANTGWAVGSSWDPGIGYTSIILKTTDSGDSWNAQTSGTTLPLNDVQIINEQNGWIVGGLLDFGCENIVLYTTNGGEEWIQQIVGDSLCLNAICFITDSIGWVVGGSYDPEIGFIPIILKTTNGGNNWICQSAPTEWPLNDVYFIDANIGFIAGGMGHAGLATTGVILKTTNGGDTWIEQTAPDEIAWYGISFSDAQNGIVVGGRAAALGYFGEIFRTADGGTNWLLALEIEYSRFHGVTVIDSNHVWAVGTPILFSSDKGINWTNQGAFPNYLLNDVCFVNSSTGWVVGSGGIILHTTNGGVSFVEEEVIDEMPTEFLLSQNYPNPFNPSTKIKYSLPQSSRVHIKIFDVLGTEIETLVNEEKQVGTYELMWNAANLPSGVYFYQLIAGDFVQKKKMILIK